MRTNRFNEYINEKTCMNCNKMFIEKNNIGVLECSFHPGILNTKEINGTKCLYYTCCGAYYYDFYNDRGCCRSDHMEETFDRDSIFKSVNSNYNKNIEYMKERLRNIKKFSFIIVPQYYYNSMGFRELNKDSIVEYFNYNKIEQLINNKTRKLEYDYNINKKSFSFELMKEDPDPFLSEFITFINNIEINDSDNDDSSEDEFNIYGNNEVDHNDYTCKIIFSLSEILSDISDHVKNSDVYNNIIKETNLNDHKQDKSIWKFNITDDLEDNDEDSDSDETNKVELFIPFFIVRRTS